MEANNQREREVVSIPNYLGPHTIGFNLSSHFSYHTLYLHIQRFLSIPITFHYINNMLLLLSHVAHTNVHSLHFLQQPKTFLESAKPTLLTPFQTNTFRACLDSIYQVLSLKFILPSDMFTFLTCGPRKELMSFTYTRTICSLRLLEFSSDTLARIKE